MDNKNYVNRDISWLNFNARVLQEAEDDSVPLIERIRFLGIFSNNLDEFFRVRYASIKRASQIGKKAAKLEFGGVNPEKLLAQINEVVIYQQARVQEVLDQLIDNLEDYGISMVNEKTLSDNQKEWIREAFVQKVSPSVFNLILTSLQEFPELKDKSIYLSIKLTKNENLDDPLYALIEIPSEFVGRFIEMPSDDKKYIIYLDDLIRYNLDYIFFIFEYDNIEAHTIKITRDAELDIDNDVSKSFLEKIQKSVKNRRIGDPVRFVYDRELSPDFLQYLMNRMELDNHDSLIAGGRYHNKKDLMRFPNVGGPELEHPTLPIVPHPQLSMERSILNEIRQRDIMLFMPYHSFSYIIRFLREAAIDPSVEEIKITLYRMASKSRISSALINAAKNGKKVTAVIELQARFDEENNIKWTNNLKNEGVDVVSGIPGLKVHSKIALVRRREKGKLKNYALIGTGNFHEGTAKFYTDYHLMTSNPEITDEVCKVFDFIKTNYLVQKYDHLIVSPHYSRERFTDLIDREIQNAIAGKKASIFIKMNSLSDLDMIDKLYEAGQAGVKIKMVIRGICSLIPNKIGLSENIEAISIVDRFLEHSRVFIFENDGEPLYFIGSADWMARNLDHRLEVTVPIYDEMVKSQLKYQMDLIWNDNVKARYHNLEDINAYREEGDKKIRSQVDMLQYLENQSDT